MSKEMQWEMEADFTAMGVAPELFKTLAANFHKYQRKGLQKFEDNKFKPAYGMPVADVVPKADVSAEKSIGLLDPAEPFDQCVPGWTSEEIGDYGLDFLPTFEH